MHTFGPLPPKWFSVRPCGGSLNTKIFMAKNKSILEQTNRATSPKTDVVPFQRLGVSGATHFQKAMQPSPANSEDGFVKENKRIIKTNSLIPFFSYRHRCRMPVWGRGEPIFPSAHRPKLIRVDTLREWMNAKDSEEDHRKTLCAG